MDFSTLCSWACMTVPDGWWAAQGLARLVPSQLEDLRAGSKLRHPTAPAAFSGNMPKLWRIQGNMEPLARMRCVEEQEQGGWGRNEGEQEGLL